MTAGLNFPNCVIHKMRAYSGTRSWTAGFIIGFGLSHGRASSVTDKPSPQLSNRVGPVRGLVALFSYLLLERPRGEKQTLELPSPRRPSPPVLRAYFI